MKKNKNLPEALRQLQLLSFESVQMKERLDQYVNEFSAGEMGKVPDWASMEVKNSEVKKQAYESQEVINTQNFICLFPGSVWATKKWTIDGFIKVAKHYSQKYPVVLMGGKDEVEIGNQIQKQIPTVQNEIGQNSLIQTIEKLRKAKIVISNDSGGQHLAAVVGVPTVSIFGPTVLDFGYRPWNPQAIVIENSAIGCRPCGPHGHQKCPIGTHECMTSISAEKVITAADQLLSLS